MPFAGILWSIVTWIFRESVVKFLLMGLIYLVLSTLLPILMGYISGFLDTSSLNSAFSGLSPGVWWFLDFAQLDYGLPRLLAAAIAVFIIRRIPFLH